MNEIERAAKNTDRELWREREGDYYTDSIHVTEGGRIGINCGGNVIVKPLREWHTLATPPVPAEVGELTPEFAAMNGRDKWETLVLNGLIGTDEPWIAAMRDTLRAEAALLERYAAALERIAERAGELRKGTDDWFDLVEFENVARTALQTKP